MRKLMVFLMLLTFLNPTTISGKIINADTLETMENVIIRVSGDASFQSIFNDNYSLDLSPGNYRIEALYYEDKTVKYSTDEEITVRNEKINYDLVLFPGEIQAEYNFEEAPIVEDLPEAGKAELDYGLIALLAVILLVILYYLYKSYSTTKPEPKTEPEIKLDEDCEKVLKILREQEGRMLQKELRDILKFSESKMSLVIAELEASSKIKRIKRGRENIIKLA